MTAADVIATLALAAILGGAITYIIRSKKSGAKCIGCPHSKQCSSAKSDRCGCCGSDKEGSENN